MSIEAMKQALEALEKSQSALAEELSAWDIDPPLHHVQESHDLCAPAITSLRQAIAEAEKQDKFCDDNCVWTDHHKDCVRASVSWKYMAFARLGVVRDKMHQDDIETVQRFLDGDYTHPQPKREQEHVACQHKRYSIDVTEQIGTCYDCGSEGRMRFVVDDTHPQPKREPL